MKVLPRPRLVLPERQDLASQEALIRTLLVPLEFSMSRSLWRLDPAFAFNYIWITHNRRFRAKYVQNPVLRLETSPRSAASCSTESKYRFTPTNTAHDQNLNAVSSRRIQSATRVKERKQEIQEKIDDFKDWTE